MLLSDYIKSEFRSLHYEEPLSEADVNWLVRQVQNKPEFRNATREEIIRAAPFKISDAKYYVFYNVSVVEAESEDEAIEKFANSSENFAGGARRREFETEDEADDFLNKF